MADSTPEGSLNGYPDRMTNSTPQFFLLIYLKTYVSLETLEIGTEFRVEIKVQMYRGGVTGENIFVLETNEKLIRSETAVNRTIEVFKENYITLVFSELRKYVVYENCPYKMFSQHHFDVKQHLIGSSVYNEAGVYISRLQYDHKPSEGPIMFLDNSYETMNIDSINSRLVLLEENVASNFTLYSGEISQIKGRVKELDNSIKETKDQLNSITTVREEFQTFIENNNNNTILGEVNRILDQKFQNYFESGDVTENRNNNKKSHKVTTTSTATRKSPRIVKSKVTGTGRSAKFR